MSDRRRQIAAVIAVLVAASLANADMVTVSAPTAWGAVTVPESAQSTSPYTELLRPFYSDSEAGWDLWSCEAGVQPIDDMLGAAHSAQAQILTDGSDSLSLCLWALIGLGLCRSGQWVRRLSLGFVPEWYHSGGPFQIGHSHAVLPNNLASAFVPVCCFVQPVFAVESPILIQRSRIVRSSWRKSQFAPAALASRGPPSLS